MLSQILGVSKKGDGESRNINPRKAHMLQGLICYSFGGKHAIAAVESKKVSKLTPKCELEFGNTEVGDFSQCSILTSSKRWNHQSRSWEG